MRVEFREIIMNAMNSARIELLRKDNYDTWKLQMRAVLIKNDLWNYVSGILVKPEGNNDDVQSWTRNDQKAMSDIILSINPNELRLVKKCVTSRDMWLKLQETYESKGPARKATLLKKLTLLKMADGDDVRAHLDDFFDAVDKLHDMDVIMNQDQLTIMLLYSLPANFENFRIAIESRDDLPTPEILRVKIVEEHDARRNIAHGGGTSNAMLVNKGSGRKNRKRNTETHTGDSKATDRLKGSHEVRCYGCKQTGHKKKDCPRKQQDPSAKCADDVCFNTMALSTSEMEGQRRRWCLDSGATTHLCNDASSFREINSSRSGILNLANCTSTKTEGEGTAQLAANVSGGETSISLSNTLLVPDLRTNLLSVSKIVDRNFEVLFRKESAVVLDSRGEVKMRADRVGDLFFARESRSASCAASTVPKSKAITLELLHRRMGHTNVRDIRDAVHKGIVSEIKIDNIKELSCDVCAKGKMSRSPFPKSSGRNTGILELVHTDVCGPMRTESIGGARYFVEFIDDCTG